jgi:hypothetical protein
MRAEEGKTRCGQARPPAGYAVLGACALAVSLAGVMGGHQLVGRLFGAPEEEQAFALDRESDADCPAHLRAADACDYEGDGPVPRRRDDGCGGDHEAEPVLAPQLRQATAHGAASAEPGTFTWGR